MNGWEEEVSRGQQVVSGETSEGEVSLDREAEDAHKQAEREPSISPLTPPYVHVVVQPRNREMHPSEEGPHP